MPIVLTCECGSQLRVSDAYAGKLRHCPACGRVLAVPALVSEPSSVSEWQIDHSPSVPERAEAAGVVQRGRASVVLLHATHIQDRALEVEGAANCWYCHGTVRLGGCIFGRTGLGGTLATLTCPKCTAGAWIGFASHRLGSEAHIYIYAPSHTRDFTVPDSRPLPAPTFRIDKVSETDSADAARGAGRLDQSVFALFQAVAKREPLQETNTRIAQLVGQQLSPAQSERISSSLRTMLSKEQNTSLSVLLAEALASLRDESAADDVDQAVCRALARENPKDPNQSLQDLCVLGLLFGRKQGFLEAMERSMAALPATTRGCKLGNRLTLQEIGDLIRQEESIHSFESTLGGAHWQRIHSLVPPWQTSKKEDGRKSWISRLFGR